MGNETANRGTKAFSAEIKFEYNIYNRIIYNKMK